MITEFFRNIKFPTHLICHEIEFPGTKKDNTKFFILFLMIISDRTLHCQHRKYKIFKFTIFEFSRSSCLLIIRAGTCPLNWRRVTQQFSRAHWLNSFQPQLQNQEFSFLKRKMDWRSQITVQARQQVIQVLFGVMLPSPQMLPNPHPTLFQVITDIARKDEVECFNVARSKNEYVDQVNKKIMLTHRAMRSLKEQIGNVQLLGNYVILKLKLILPL